MSSPKLSVYFYVLFPDQRKKEKERKKQWIAQLGGAGPGGEMRSA